MEETILERPTTSGTIMWFTAAIPFTAWFLFTAVQEGHAASWKHSSEFLGAHDPRSHATGESLLQASNIAQVSIGQDGSISASSPASRAESGSARDADADPASGVGEESLLAVVGGLFLPYGPARESSSPSKFLESSEGYAFFHQLPRPSTKARTLSSAGYALSWKGEEVLTLVPASVAGARMGTPLRFSIFQAPRCVEARWRW